MRRFAVTIEFLPIGSCHYLIVATSPAVAAAVLTQAIGLRPYGGVHWFAGERDDWRAARDADTVLVLSRGGETGWDLNHGLE